MNFEIEARTALDARLVDLNLSKNNFTTHRGYTTTSRMVYHPDFKNETVGDEWLERAKKDPLVSISYSKFTSDDFVEIGHALPSTVTSTVLEV